MSQPADHSIENFNLFPWNDNFATGIELIDQQHQQLVNILNRLARHTVSGVMTKEQLWGVLDELVAYTDYHFRAEEEIWRQEFTGHQLLVEHEHAHRAFFEKIQSIRESGQDIEEFINDLFGFLTRWLAFHILDSDRRMALATLGVQDGLSLEHALAKAQQQMTGSLAVLIHAILDMYGELSARAIEMMQQRLGRLRAEQALREAQARLIEQQAATSEARYQMLFLAIPDSVFVLRYEDLVITDLNPVAQQLVGVPREDVIGTHLQSLHPVSTRKLVLDHLDAFRAGRDTQVRFETRMLDSEAHETEVEVSISGPFELRHEQSLVAIYRDISAVKRHQDQLEYVAYHDPQTGLLNRSGIKDILDACLRDASDKDLPVLLLHLDVDNFSKVNDRFGVAVGDLVLMAFAERIVQTVPAAAHVGRIGGDEFLVMMKGVSTSLGAAGLVADLMQDLEKPLRVEGLSLNLTVSVGANLAESFEGLTSEAFLRQTSHASYLAKLQGIAQLRFFDRAEELVIRDRHTLIEEIRAAIPHNEFELYYQPKINMDSGAVIGVEALIRWNHPVRGLLSPEAFIPATQDHEIALILGRWVLETALRQLDCWSHSHPELVVSINISSYEVQTDGYADEVIRCLSAWPEVNPSRLQLELLESSAMNSLPIVIQNLQRCRDAGIKIAIDDFGTGYSSLSYLKRLPVDWLKLDQSFVRDMGGSGDDRAIISGVLAISQAYGLEVIAEGVETAQQRDQLIALGCHFGQGFGIGKPMPVDKFMIWLSDWQKNNGGL